MSAETKFTPPVWKVEIADPNTYADHVIFSASNNTVCEVNAACSDFRELDVHVENINWEESIANAHLIASAPRMYWMLGDIRDFLKRSGYDCTLVNEVMAQARGEA